MKKAFTLMEVIISLAIITTALISIIALIVSSISGISANESKITAFGLAQEGLEIVRSIRDNNWLDYKRTAENWRDGLEAGIYRVQYNSPALLADSHIPLRIDGNGFYRYSGILTKFYRKIIVSDVDGDDNQFKVVVEVSWQEKGRDLTMTAESRLYNWLKEE